MTTKFRASLIIFTLGLAALAIAILTAPPKPAIETRAQNRLQLTALPAPTTSRQEILGPSAKQETRPVSPPSPTKTRSPAQIEVEAVLAALDQARLKSRPSFTEAPSYEASLLTRLQSLGPEILARMLEDSSIAAHRAFLASALASLEGSLAVAEEGLGRLEAGEALSTLARGLPAGKASADSLGRAFVTQPQAEARRILLRELIGRKSAGRALLLRAARQDADPGIRGESVAALARIGDQQDIDVLAGIARRDVDGSVRERALVTLGAIGGPQAAAVIVSVAQDQQASANLRASAAVALGRIGGQAARRALAVLAQSDPDRRVRERASSILRLLDEGPR